jgi:hypothetical protein
VATEHGEGVPELRSVHRLDVASLLEGILQRPCTGDLVRAEPAAPIPRPGLSSGSCPCTGGDHAGGSPVDR